MFCRRCGDSTDHQVEVVSRGETLFHGGMCHPCFHAVSEEHFRRKAEFDAMIEAGVDRDYANTIMVNRVLQGPALA